MKRRRHAVSTRLSWLKNRWGPDQKRCQPTTRLLTEEGRGGKTYDLTHCAGDIEGVKGIEKGRRGVRDGEAGGSG